MRKAESLVKLLALSRGRRMHRDRGHLRVIGPKDRGLASKNSGGVLRAEKNRRWQRDEGCGKDRQPGASVVLDAAFAGMPQFEVLHKRFLRCYIGRMYAGSKKAFVGPRL